MCPHSLWVLDQADNRIAGRVGFFVCFLGIFLGRVF